MSEPRNVRDIIEQSDSNESQKDSLQKQLDIADDIMKSVSDIPELRDKFQKEYDEFLANIIGAKKTYNSINSQELKKIKLSFEDIINLKSENIDEYLNKKIESKGDLNGLETKVIEEYTPQDAILALNYLQSVYESKYLSNNNVKNATSLLSYSSINDLFDQNDVFLFQQKLISKITGSDDIIKNGFNSQYILCVDKEKGNYLVNINDFKKSLSYSNFEIDYFNLKNYVSYIETNEGVFDIEKIDKKNLEKYIPGELIGDFIKKYKKQISSFEFYRWAEDNVEEGEYDIIFKYLEKKDYEYIDHLISKGLTKEEILEILIKNNSKFKKEITQYKKEHKTYYQNKEKQNTNEQDEEQNQKDKKENIQSNQNNIYEKYDGSTFNKESGVLNFESKGEKINLKLDNYEKKLVENNILNLDKIIKLYELFDDLNLISIWKYKQDLIASIGNLGINWKDDFLTKDEIVLFGNSIINFINNIPNNEKKLKNQNSFGGIKNELQHYAGANLKKNGTYNSYGDDKFGNQLRELGIIGNSLGFQRNKFREILSGNKAENNKN